MTNLAIGDTVIAKHNNIWTKGCITKINSHPYYSSFCITFTKESVETLYIPYNEAEIIKVDSDFNIACNNCKYRTKGYFDEPCNGCLAEQHYYWEPCDSLKNKDKVKGLFTDKKYVDLAGYWPLKPEKLDVASFYPKFENKQKIKPDHSDNIDVLRYCINDVKACTELMEDFNKKENKNMKKKQWRRNRDILVAKNLNAAIEFDEIKFNGPATIIKWKPTFAQLALDEKPDKTVTVCKEPDKFDKTTGFLLAVLKELLDNKSYGNILEKIDEINKVDKMADLNNKTELHHCSIKDLKEATEALENAYHPGSVVRYKNGKKYYMVYAYRFDDQLKEMVYILRPYKGTCFTDNNLEDACKNNVPHSKLIIVRRK